MQDPDRVQNTLCNQAMEAELAGHPEVAAGLFRRAIGVDRSNPVPYLFLGYVLNSMGQQDRAVQVWSLAADLDPRVINAWRNQSVSPEIGERSQIADRRLREHFTRLHKESVIAYAEHNPRANLERVEAAIWCQTHAGEFEYRHPRQQPHLFFVPDITPIAVYTNEHMPWKASLEASIDVIKTELQNARDTGAANETPYLEPRAAGLGDDWKPIAGSLNWGSYQLYRKGVPSDALLDLFPETLRILNELPIKSDGRPREIVFSVLQGKQRIPPHYGVSNTDMTVHLPLVTNDNSAIRVVDHVHDWQEGKVFAFDDSFDHESWNDSPEARVNLIFEVWHPELTEHERDAISAAFAARERWNQGRKV